MLKIRLSAAVCLHSSCFILHPPVSHLLHPTVIFPRLKRWLLLLYTNVLLSFRLSLFFFFNICNGKSTRGNLLQLFLSCHQGDAVRRASVEPWGGGRQGEKGRGEEWVKGTQSPQTHVHMCIWGLSVHTHIHTCVVLYNKYQSATDHLSVVIITVIGKNFFFL